MGAFGSDSFFPQPERFLANGDCSINNCKQCYYYNENSCYECKDGYANTGDACEDEDTIFSDVTASVVENGLVGMSSPTLHKFLSDSYDGKGSRYNAVKLVSQAFTRAFKDEYKFIIVYPSAALATKVSHQEFFSASGLGGTSTLEGLIAGGNPCGGCVKAIIHEIGHNYITPSAILDNNFFGSHWGFTSLGASKQGQLGGYAKEGVKCKSPSVAMPEPGASCDTNDLIFDPSYGGPQSSNDGAKPGDSKFAAVELYMMGLLTTAEYKGQSEHIAYCPIKAQQDVFYDKNAKLYSAKCTGTKGFQLISPSDVVQKWTPTGRELSKGEQVKAAVVVLYPDMKTLIAAQDKYDVSGTVESWLKSYFSTTLPANFKAATGDRATISFAAVESDIKTDSKIETVKSSNLATYGSGSSSGSSGGSGSSSNGNGATTGATQGTGIDAGAGNMDGGAGSPVTVAGNTGSKTAFSLASAALSLSVAVCLGIGRL
jgi:hypothetical protein